MCGSFHVMCGCYNYVGFFCQFFPYENMVFSGGQCRYQAEATVSPLCLVCGSTNNCQTSVLGSSAIELVVDEDVKKPTNQPTKQTKISSGSESGVKCVSRGL